MLQALEVDERSQAFHEEDYHEAKVTANTLLTTRLINHREQEFTKGCNPKSTHLFQDCAAGSNESLSSTAALILKQRFSCYDFILAAHSYSSAPTHLDLLVLLCLFLLLKTVFAVCGSGAFMCIHTGEK